MLVISRLVACASHVPARADIVVAGMVGAGAAGAEAVEVAALLGVLEPVMPALVLPPQAVANSVRENMAAAPIAPGSLFRIGATLTALTTAREG